MTFFLMVILFMVVQPTYQVLYTCNPAAVCGCSSKNASVTRIVGGEEAGLATWGWAVSISFDDNYICGGSILSSSWILTAAHCTDGFLASQIIVYVGSNTLWVGTQSRVVSQVIQHIGYNHTNYFNDISLLKLASPLNMSDPNIAPICLPFVDPTILAVSEWPPATTTVIAVGWGTLYSGGTPSNTLEQVTLHTEDYRALNCSPLVTDWHKQLCADDGGKDTCQGDSGGPLVMFAPSNRWILVGITSFGIGCASNYSGVYTRVADYKDWIMASTNDSYWTAVGSQANTIATSTIHLFGFSVLIFFRSITSMN